MEREDRQCDKRKLFTFVLASSCVYGDVFQLTTAEKDAITATPPEAGGINDFDAFISANAEALPGTAMNPFAPLASGDWQMLGYAIYFPNGVSAPQQIYVAKRNSNGVAAAPGNLNYGSSEHTERQLLCALAQVAGVRYPAAVGGEAAVAVNAIPPARFGTINGTFHIYTLESPCVSAFFPNVSCVEYYRNIQPLFPNAQFHIYFSVTGLDSSTVTAAIANAVARTIASFLQPDAVMANAFRRPSAGAAILEYNIARRGSPIWTDASANATQFINRVNRAITQKIFTPQQKTAIFNAAYPPPPHFTYHAL